MNPFRKKTLLVHLFGTLLFLANKKLGLDLELNISVAPNDSDFPEKRDLAYTDGKNIVVSQKLLNLPMENQIAVLAHEIAHCIYMHYNIGHTESQTDHLVERVFGFTVYYDENEVQTTRNTGMFRPNHLPI